MLTCHVPLWSSGSSSRKGPTVPTRPAERTVNRYGSAVSVVARDSQTVPCFFPFTARVHVRLDKRGINPALSPGPHNRKGPPLSGRGGFSTERTIQVNTAVDHVHFSSLTASENLLLLLSVFSTAGFV